MTTTYDAAAILLDMDGTLVDSTPVVERAWTAWARRYGVDPQAVLDFCHGRQGYVTMAQFLPDRPHEINLAENRELLRAETADVDGITAIGGAADFLAALHTIPHALVTSADTALAAARMGAAGLAMPATTITAEDVTESKPDPEGFLAAAALLGVQPADCLVFEDSAAGIAAARAAGMRVIGVGSASAAATADLHLLDYLGVVVEQTSGGVRLTFP